MVGVALVAQAVDALLGFENEVPSFVEVDPIRSGRAVGFFAFDAALERVGIQRIVFDWRIGSFEIKKVAKVEEELVTDPALVSAGGFPTDNKGVDGFR